MPRPQRCRRICAVPEFVSFVPEGGCTGEIVISTDEFEVIRIVDHEGQTHEQCAAQMDVSRTTVTEMYENARRKLADGFVNGKRIVIAGGNYRLCDGSAGQSCGRNCYRTGEHPIPEKKGDSIMRIAVTYDNGFIFQHFGRTEQFKVYDIEDNKVVDAKVIGTNGTGHGALAGLLAAGGVDVLICGGIGGGAQMALVNAGVKLFGGVSGLADDAVQAFLAGELGYNPDVRCDHHGHGEHNCGSHSCGSEGHNCGGGHSCH